MSTEQPKPTAAYAALRAEWDAAHRDRAPRDIRLGLSYAGRPNPVVRVSYVALERPRESDGQGLSRLARDLFGRPWCIAHFHGVLRSSGLWRDGDSITAQPL